MWAAPIAVVALVVLGFVAIGYIQGRWTWDGTGFEGASLWDWLDLLIVPVALGIGGIWFQRAQRSREIERQESQGQRELEVQEQRAQDDLLQAYLDQMGQLLLDADQPLDKAGPFDTVSRLARARTLTVLQRLDGRRKTSVLRFIYEADLVSYAEPEEHLIGLNLVFTLSHADLSAAALQGTEFPYIYLANANLIGANLRLANLNEAQLLEANLFKADLSRASLLNRVNLFQAYLVEAVLREVYLDEANLSHATLRKADLSDAKLSKADLRWADLSDAKLNGANLTEASLMEAKLIGTDLSGANLTNAHIASTDLRESKGLTQEQIELSKGNRETMLPKGLSPPESWDLLFVTWDQHWLKKDRSEAARSDKPERLIATARAADRARELILRYMKSLVRPFR
jgi:uncharacterized protein YjbI with pentapeptide repeats